MLLILSGITIAQLSENGLFEKVKLAKEESKNAQDDENDKIAKYNNEIDSYVGGNRDYEAEINVLKEKIEKLKAANSYSTEEQVDGTYLNNKPLYKKTITDTTAATNGGFKTIWTGDSNITIINAEGWVKATNGVKCPICYDDTSGSGLTYHYSGGNRLCVQSKGNIFVYLVQ